tara:strand:- start:661 stop:1002 length:342 start_codon:yes stop_codon:yes gene_type:complete
MARMHNYLKVNKQECNIVYIGCIREMNYTQEESKEEVYLESTIKSWIKKWEEFSEKKGVWEQKKQVMCEVHSDYIKHSPLSLRECNDGSNFTSVNQSINQAKMFLKSMCYGKR